MRTHPRLPALALTALLAAWGPTAAGQDGEAPAVPGGQALDAPLDRAERKAAQRGGWLPKDERELTNLHLDGIPVAVRWTDRGPLVAWAHRRALDSEHLASVVTVSHAVTGATLGEAVGPRGGVGSGPILAADLSPDGRRLAVSFSKPDALVLVSLGDAATQVTLEGHRLPPRAVTFTPDDERLITGDGDGVGQLRDGTTGGIRRTLEGDGKVRALASGGGLLAIGGDDHLSLWSLEDGGRIAPAADTPWVPSPLGAHAAALSSTGWPLVTSHDKLVWAWSEGRRDGRLLSHEGTPALARVIDLALTPDGRHVAVAHSARWRAGEQRWSSDADATVRLLDVESGKELYRFRGHLGQVAAIDVSLDGATLLSGAADFTVRTWDLAGLDD